MSLSYTINFGENKKILYLIEKARSDAIDVFCKEKIEIENNVNDIALNDRHDKYDEQKKREDEKLNGKQRDRANNNKSVVFLIYNNRYSDEFPLIFSNEWKQVFVDTLLPLMMQKYKK